MVYSELLSIENSDFFHFPLPTFISTVNETDRREALDELNRQIELILNFIAQRKHLGARDTDLHARLHAYMRERDDLIRSAELEQKKRIAS